MGVSSTSHASSISAFVSWFENNRVSSLVISTYYLAPLKRTTPSEQDKRNVEYVLTEKGLDLLPLLVEMANWSAEHDPHTAAPAAWIALMKAEREQMIRVMRETVQSGSSVFVGEKSLLGQFV